MKSVHPEERPWRIRARFALNWPAAASGQISATFHANSARAARLNEPVATLSGLVQTGSCIHPSPAAQQSSAAIETASAVNPTKSICTDLAHLPEPLTAPGAAQACPACLPSPSNQRTFLDPLGHARPFDPSSHLPLVGLRADRIGSVIVSPREGRKREIPIHEEPSTRPAYLGEIALISGGFNPSPALGHLAFPHLSGISSLPNVIEQSDFPWKSRPRFFDMRKSSVLRVSGTLRSASAFQIINLIK